MTELPQERAGRPAPPEIQERREAMRAALHGGVWRTGQTPVVEALGGVRVLRFQLPGARRGGLLHLHGGGFRMGCPEMVGPFAAALRDQGGGPLILSGDSAGGGLAAGLTALSVAQGWRPAGLVLLSPWLDLTGESPCYQANAASDPLFSLEAAQLAAELYLQGLSPRDPLASPIFAEVAGFPPTFVSIGSGEVLADDGRRFVRALHAAGAPATLLAAAGMDHVAVTRGLELPGAAQTFDALAAFIDGLL